jgi:hypothetical protein
VAQAQFTHSSYLLLAFALDSLYGTTWHVANVIECLADLMLSLMANVPNNSHIDTWLSEMDSMHTGDHQARIHVRSRGREQTSLVILKC